MIILSQRQKEWADAKIGQSNLTLGHYGCTCTSISMLSDYFGHWISPDQIASHKDWFTDKTSIMGPGMILWNKLNFDCMEFVTRGYSRNDLAIQEAIKDPNSAVLLEFQLPKNKHWTVALGRGLFGGYRIADPWDGKKKSSGIYGDAITGYSIFKRK